jgi:hypothetical protein
MKFAASPFDTEKCLNEYCFACCAVAEAQRKKSNNAFRQNRINAVRDYNGFSNTGIGGKFSIITYVRYT